MVEKFNRVLKSEQCVYVCRKTHWWYTGQKPSWGAAGGQPSRVSVTSLSRHLALTCSNVWRWERVASHLSASPPSACGVFQCVWRSCVFILVYLFRSLWCDATAVPSRSTSIWFWGWWKWGKCVLSWVCGQCFFALRFLECCGFDQVLATVSAWSRRPAGVWGPRRGHMRLLLVCRLKRRLNSHQVLFVVCGYAWSEPTLKCFLIFKERPFYNLQKHFAFLQWNYHLLHYLTWTLNDQFCVLNTFCMSFLSPPPLVAILCQHVKMYRYVVY